MMFQYQQGRSWFHRLDPGSKFIWVICISSLSILYEEAAPQAILLLTVFLFGRLAAGLPFRSMLRGIRFPLWFGIPYFLLQLLFVPGERALFSIGTIVVTAEAMDYAAAIAMRLLTLVLASLVFIAATDPRDAVLALAQQLRLPYKFAFAVSIAMRFLPILSAEAASVRAAQRLRGAAGIPGSRLKARIAEFRRFAFMVFVNAIRRVQRIAETMESRAFGLHADRTYRRKLIVPASGRWLTFGSLLLTGILMLFYFLTK